MGGRVVIAADDICRWCAQMRWAGGQVEWVGGSVDVVCDGVVDVDRYVALIFLTMVE